MKKLFNGFCYLIYRSGRKYLQSRILEELHKTAIIHEGATIGETGVIKNGRDRSSISIGNKTILSGELMTFRHGGEIKIGDYCFIGERTKIWSAKKITIGNRVLIAHNVNIHDQVSHPLDSHLRHLDQVHIMEKGFQEQNDLHEKEVIIGDDAWIGFNATILKGVRIGKGAIIGACTLVTQDVPDFAVVVGNPPQIIKYTT